MKTPKEKAEELVGKYRRMFYGRKSIPAKKKAIRCALIAVDEIIHVLNSIPDLDVVGNTLTQALIYWWEVRKEMNYYESK